MFKCRRSAKFQRNFYNHVIGARVRSRNESHLPSAMIKRFEFPFLGCTQYRVII